MQFHNDRRMPHRELRRDPVGPTLGKQVGRSKAQLFYAELRRAVPGIAAASVVHRQLPRCCVVHSERSALGFRGPPAVAFVAFALPNNLVLGQGTTCPFSVSISQRFGCCRLRSGESPSGPSAARTRSRSSSLCSEERPRNLFQGTKCSCRYRLPCTPTSRRLQVCDRMRFPHKLSIWVPFLV